MALFGDVSPAINTHSIPFFIAYCLPDSNWRHQFFPLVNDVLRVVQRPGPVKYSEILALERELRFCRMPEELESCVISPMMDTLSNKDITKHLQGITALMWRESGAYFSFSPFFILLILIIF